MELIDYKLPPSGVIIPPNAEFWIQLWNSNASATFLQVRWVIVKGNGEAVRNQMQYNLTAGVDFTSNRAINNIHVPIGPGALVAFEINYGNATVKKGETFVNVLLAQTDGLIIIKSLGSGYVYAGHSFIFPICDNEEPVPDTVGAQLNATGTTPAVSTEMTITVPTNALYQLKGIRALITTSATAGNRSGTFFVKDASGNTLQNIPSGIATGASNTGTYVATAGHPVLTNASGTVVFPIPAEMTLFPGFTFGISFNVASGDQVSAIRYWGNQWIQV